MKNNCTRDDCRFVDEGSATTLMWSPIVYDKHGNPVGGGDNSVRKAVRCLSCGKTWISSAKEIDDVLGKPRDWREVE